jgi:predicted transcriptional regulator
MSEKTVTRSVRLDEETNTNLESLAAAASMTVSEYIRWAIAELTVRDVRVADRRRALAALAKLPVPEHPDKEREEMWGIGSRVPR